MDIHSELPPEIEACAPDNYLYPEQDYALGFISRGCPRKCPWCVVPRKEGGLRRVSTSPEIVGNYKRAVFLDNNFLALPDCQVDLDWLAQNKISVDFNQALDARLVTPEIAKLLARVKWYPNLRLSLDSDGMLGQVKTALDNLQAAGVAPSTVRIFTLIGFSGFASDVQRLSKIHAWGSAPFPMGYRDNDTGLEPARGWNLKLYRKYRRLLVRLPMAKSVWADFERDVTRARSIPAPEKPTLDKQGALI